MTDGTTTWNYTYDANGLRTQRTNGTTTYTYIYSGSQLVQMQVGSDTLYFTYDPLTGAPVTVEHNGTVYYYITNQQGDVIGISGNWGNGEQNYYYDAWGRPVGATSTTGIMQLNPLRYRGYVYDRETGLYYLQSRYYDPEIGRFINADDYISTEQGLLSRNVFAYCLNNPVSFADRSGESPWLIVGIVAACAAIIGIDHALAANQPEGGYALLNETNEKGATKKVLYAEGNGFDIDENGIILCDTDAGLASFSLENEYVDIELLDCLTASATAELDWSGVPSVDVSAAASIYSPSVEIILPLGIINITFTAEALIGAVGIGAELDVDSGKIKITPPTVGVGGSFGVDIDLIN